LRLKNLSLGLAVFTFLGCVRAPPPPPAEAQPDLPFPNFFAQQALTLDPGKQTYELDGVTLRALLVAANDYRPRHRQDPPCRDRQEAQRYRLLRQGDVLFIQIDPDDAYCGSRYLSLDMGARYAIGLDGRILRRSFGIEPEVPPRPDTMEAGARPATTGDAGTPDAPSVADSPGEATTPSPQNPSPGDAGPPRPPR